MGRYDLKTKAPVRGGGENGAAMSICRITIESSGDEALGTPARKVTVRGSDLDGVDLDLVLEQAFVCPLDLMAEVVLEHCRRVGNVGHPDGRRARLYDAAKRYVEEGPPPDHRA